jgi:hypothetical protein
MNNTDEIFDVLRRISQAGEKVRLINVYKGYPIAYPAQILSIGIDAVTFKVHPYQALCLWMENQTFIQHDRLPEIVRAQAVTVDLEAEITALSNFEYVSGAPGKRQDERVQLRKPIEVYLTLRGQKFRTELRDLSSGGLAVVLDAAYYDPDKFNQDEPLQLMFQLPEAEQGATRDVTLNGSIRSVTRDQVNRYRLGIQIHPSGEHELPVSRFVDLRQAEVLQEIDMLHESILSLRLGETEDVDSDIRENQEK